MQPDVSRDFYILRDNFTSVKDIFTVDMTIIVVEGRTCRLFNIARARLARHTTDNISIIQNNNVDVKVRDADS